MKEGLAGGFNFYRASKLDWVLIGIILFFSLASFLWIALRGLPQSSQAREAIIYQKGLLLGKVELDKDRMLSLLNGQMQIEVKNRKIRVIKAECPQHVCMNMGWIQYSGQALICAPNKIVIEVKSKGSPLLDAVVY